MPPTSIKALNQEANDDNLAQQIIALHASINIATYRLLVLIEQFDTGHCAIHQGFLNTVQWLGYYCGIGPNAAREKVRVANALTDLPAIAAAFAAGKVSYSKVRALTRVSTPHNEVALLNLAKHATAQQTEHMMRDYESIHAEGLIGSTRSSLTWHHERGEVTFKVRLPAELAELLIQSISKGMQQSDAQVSLEERRADALVALAEQALSVDTSAGSSADRYTVHVELNAQSPHGTQPPQVRHGRCLTQAAIERLTCDGALVLHDVEGGHIGRKTRTVPGSMRRALQRRDQGCRFPGCTQHRFVDAHHIHHWAHGGGTKLSNLILLCRRHHRLIHEEGFKVRAHRPEQSTAQFRFYAPTGEFMPTTQDIAPTPITPLHVTAVTSKADAPLKTQFAQRRPNYHAIGLYLANDLSPG